MKHIGKSKKAVKFVITAAVIMIAVAAEAASSADLVEEVKHAGLSLVYNGTTRVDLQKRQIERASFIPLPQLGSGAAAISPDASRVAFPSTAHGSGEKALAIANEQGRILHVFEGIVTPDYYCWSSDNRRLAVVAKEANSGWYGVLVVDTTTGSRTRVAKGYVSQPCWAPDSQRFVYFQQESASVAIYDIASGTSRLVSKGRLPTWSPDGKWLTFESEGKYVIQHVNTGEKKKVISAKRADTALWWSPNSDFLAYIGPLGVSEAISELAGETIVEEVRVRVRRMRDGKETWVLKMSGKTPLSRFYWVQKRKETAQSK